MTAKTRKWGLLFIVLAVLLALAVGWWRLGRQPEGSTADKPLGALTREEVQRQLVGNWQSTDGAEHVLAFDERWRVSFDGRGTGLQEFHPDVVAGRVTYEIHTSAGLPVLQINYPTGAEKTPQRLCIRQLASDGLEWAEEGAEPGNPTAFRRMPGATLSVINEEDSGDDPVTN